MQAKGQWKYFYHVVNLKEYTNHYFLKKKQKAAKGFFKKALRPFYILKPFVITIDKNTVLSSC
ncbi:DDE-type integrase/transposase/recombinase [Bacillus sp. Xin]|nr:DDE-type integrase/transposase/recombinase [Bacillus sp. Xin]NSW35589.1 DDE-type integrase/transposase/recombinase [Bacillus sp. Xin1]